MSFIAGRDAYEKPTYKWPKWLIPDRMLLYRQYGNGKLPVCFLICLFPFSKILSPFFILYILMWVISAHIITPVGESSSSVRAGIILKYYLTQSSESSSSMTRIIFHSPMGIMMLRREALLTKAYSESCRLFELDYKLPRAGTLSVMFIGATGTDRPMNKCQ